MQDAILSGTPTIAFPFAGDQVEASYLSTPASYLFLSIPLT